MAEPNRPTSPSGSNPPPGPPPPSGSNPPPGPPPPSGSPPPSGPAGSGDDDGGAFVGRAGVPWEDDTMEGDPIAEDTLAGERPYIDAEELAGLGSASAPPVSTRRVMPLSDEPSNLVSRYLFPTERYRGEWRRHLIHLATPLTVGVSATVLLGLAGGFAQATLAMAWVAGLAVLVWLVIMGWVAWQVAYWHFDRFILTNKRVMKVSGIITRDVAMMPLLRVTDMKYEQTPLGRILSYGTFVIESAGQDQALREIPHLPNPNELYLRVVEEMYDPDAVEERVDSTGDENERKRGGDA